MFYKFEDILIKPGSKEEKAYCKKYNIEFIKLDNGIRIVAIPCTKDSTFWASIKWDFSEGSYNNQPSSVHFLEHFINKKVRPIAERNHCKLGAYTSRFELVEEISGVANPAVKDYGIWPSLKGIRDGLESPLKNVSDVKKSVQTERDVIKAEIQKNETNHDFQVGKHLREIIYSPDNPEYGTPTVTGSVDDLDKLTTKVLEDVQGNILIPKNLLISIYTEGDILIAKEVVENLRNMFIDFPRSEKSKNVLDKKLLEKINPHLKPGKIYSRDTGLKNGIITTQFAWVFREKLPSVEYFALHLLADILSTELFMYSRKMGWGYDTRADLIVQNDSTEILVLRIDQKSDNRKVIVNEINKIVSDTKNLIDDAIKLENTRQLATPVTVGDRFSWVVNGIKRYGSMLDVDKVRINRLAVESADLNKLIDQILLTEPAMVITGDLA